MHALSLVTAVHIIRFIRARMYSEQMGAMFDCGAGHPVLGHPKIYINLDGTSEGNPRRCGYCGLGFIKRASSSGGLSVDPKTGLVETQHSDIFYYSNPPSDTDAYVSEFSGANPKE